MTDATRAAVRTCNQCGEDAEEFREGVCAECCVGNQSRLDLHNAEYDRWQRLSGKERGDEIARAARLWS